MCEEPQVRVQIAHRWAQISRGCYHVEFADEESVSKLSPMKEAGVDGVWISFHKRSHNVEVDDILQDQEDNMVFTAIFLGLRRSGGTFFLVLGHSLVMSLRCVMDRFLGLMDLVGFQQFG